jgi:hypothetical protein
VSEESYESRTCDARYAEFGSSGAIGATSDTLPTKIICRNWFGRAPLPRGQKPAVSPGYHIHVSGDN